uniref:Uncharacterized protein n=1 Tax=Rhizophora mucronata TaxID=61149 RepID=A0A2P2PHP4_RHIMU
MLEMNKCSFLLFGRQLSILMG